jgi:hypothetical protein
MRPRRRRGSARWTRSRPVRRSGPGVLSDDLGAALVAEHRGHVGVDEAGGDHVDGDVARAQLAGEGTGEADQSGLGRGVVRLPGRAGETDHRGDQHHASLAGPHHLPRGALDDPEGAGQVGVQDRGEVVLGHPQQQRVAGDPGVGDQHLDRSVPLLDLLEGLVDLGGVGDVAPDAEQPLRRLSRSVGDGDLVAGLSEGPGDGEADAPVASGDENRAAQQCTSLCWVKSGWEQRRNSCDMHTPATLSGLARRRPIRWRQRDRHRTVGFPQSRAPGWEHT